MKTTSGDVFLSSVCYKTLWKLCKAFQKSSPFDRIGKCVAMLADVIEIENWNVSLSKDTVETNLDTKTTCYMTYDEFFTTFLAANQPCVFAPEITKDWRCRREWADNKAPNFKILKDVFGECEAPIADCKRKYYNSQYKNDMTIGSYMDYWIDYRNRNYPEDMLLLYLKDWHCIKTYSDLSLYEVPKFFASDWLNEFYIQHPDLNDDYMFVYMGPKGTWTPFHADVFTSFSWSANIVGEKRWILFPPGEEKRLLDSHGQLAFDITSEELKDSTKYPNYNKDSLKCYEILQREGEIVFVPSGWHHQVWNLEDTISVNHNWINGCNIWNVWLSLKTALTNVMKEVEDCSDMENWKEHCQLMLRSCHGMNYTDFWKFLSFIVERRLNVVKQETCVASLGKWILGINHCFFDLKQAKIVLLDMTKDTISQNIFDIVFLDDKVYELITLIDEAFYTSTKRS